MAPKNQQRNVESIGTDSLLTMLQDLFILEALKAGMTAEDVRRILRIERKRVSNISKSLPQTKINQQGSK
jgi:hypothetical protein